MSEDGKAEIDTRWREIDAELADIASCKTTSDADPATREGELLEEQDALEYEAGGIYFREHEGR